MVNGVRATRALFYGLSKMAGSSFSRNCRAVSSAADKYIIKSSRPVISIARVPLHEQVWADIDKWADKIALVSDIWIPELIQIIGHNILFFYTLYIFLSLYLIINHTL